MGKSNLIMFPLFAMFMIVLVGASESFGEEEASQILSGSRSVTDEQISLFDNHVIDRYAGWGDPPWGGWEFTLFTDCLFCSESFWLALNNEFGSEFSNGHKQMSQVMWETIHAVWDENAEHVDNRDIEFVISRDPQFIEEWKELHTAGIGTDDTIFYVAIFLGIAALIGIIGIRIFGIGLAEVSITFIIKTLLFILLWGTLSLFSSSFLFSIPTLGAVLWVVLTFIYAMGCFFNLTESGEG